MLPVQRKTRSQSKQGRSHQAISAASTVRCPECGNPKLPHAACNSKVDGEVCGYVRPGLKLNTSKED